VDVPTYHVELPGLHGEILARRLRAQNMILEHRLRSRITRPAMHYSRGLLTIAACLQQHGFAVKYLNHADVVDRKQIPSLAKEADAVGISCLTPTFGIVKHVCDAVKVSKPDTVIVLGGPHVTARPRETLEECPSADFAMIGECEIRLPALLRSIDNPEPVGGTAYRVKDGSVVMSSAPVPPVVVRQLPLPAYHLLSRPLSEYAHNVRTARGCRYGCGFCTERLSWRSPEESRRGSEQVLEELEFLSARLPQNTLVHFSDAVFNADWGNTAELVDRIEAARFSLLFSLDTRADRVVENEVRALANAGFKYFRLGFESLHDDLLRACGKAATRRDQQSASDIIRRVGDDLAIHAYMLTGLPGTTHESLVLDAIEIGRMIASDTVDVVGNKILVPYPGSPYYDAASEVGISILTHDWSKYDRRSCPVYRLKNLSSDEIYSGYLLQELALALAYLDKLEACGVHPGGANENHGHVDYVYANYVRETDS